MADSEENNKVIVFGSYRKIRAKILNILVNRKDDDFFTVEHVDKTGMIKRYAGMTDIMNFLHKLETVLIPIEDEEISPRSYSPVSIFKGSRF